MSWSSDLHTRSDPVNVVAASQRGRVAAVFGIVLALALVANINSRQQPADVISAITSGVPTHHDSLQEDPPEEAFNPLTGLPEITADNAEQIAFSLLGEHILAQATALIASSVDIAQQFVDGQLSTSEAAAEFMDASSEASRLHDEWTSMPVPPEERQTHELGLEGLRSMRFSLDASADGLRTLSPSQVKVATEMMQLAQSAIDQTVAKLPY